MVTNAFEAENFGAWFRQMSVTPGWGGLGTKHPRCMVLDGLCMNVTPNVSKLMLGSLLVCGP